MNNHNIKKEDNDKSLTALKDEINEEIMINGDDHKDSKAELTFEIGNDSFAALKDDFDITVIAAQLGNLKVNDDEIMIRGEEDHKCAKDGLALEIGEDFTTVKDEFTKTIEVNQMNNNEVKEALIINGVNHKDANDEIEENNKTIIVQQLDNNQISREMLINGENAKDGQAFEIDENNKTIVAQQLECNQISTEIVINGEDHKDAMTGDPFEIDESDKTIVVQQLVDNQINREIVINGDDHKDAKDGDPFEIDENNKTIVVQQLDYNHINRETVINGHDHKNPKDGDPFEIDEGFKNEFSEAITANSVVDNPFNKEISNNTEDYKNTMDGFSSDIDEDFTALAGEFTKTITANQLIENEINKELMIKEEDYKKAKFKLLGNLDCRPRISLLTAFDPLFTEATLPINTPTEVSQILNKSSDQDNFPSGDTCQENQCTLILVEDVKSCKDCNDSDLINISSKHSTEETSSNGQNISCLSSNNETSVINCELGEQLSSIDVDVPLDSNICSTNLSYEKNTTVVSVNESSSIENTENIIDINSVPNSQEDIHRKMADLSDKINQLEEDNAELKLQLNASQQLRASLELQLTQKEEIVIKTQTESLRKDQAAKQEMKLLKEKLEEKEAENDNTPVKELQETIKLLKAREAKHLSEIANFKKVLEDYDKVFSTQLAEYRKVREEHETVKGHLANLEFAFSDVHQKYERCKKIIEGFKSNEGILREALLVSEENVTKNEQRYESLKAHAKAQLEKANQEILLMREQNETEVHKYTAIIKRLEIKVASLIDSLDQKTKECSALAALCDEVTGKV